MSELNELKTFTRGIGLEVLNEMKTALGDGYNSLTDDQRISIRDTAAKYVELQFRSKNGEEVGMKLQAVESTVTDWKVWGEFAIEDAFWKGVQRVSETLGSFLAGFAVEAVERIVPGL